MINLSVLIWISAWLLVALGLSVLFWRALMVWLPQHPIPYWQLSFWQVGLSALVCWYLKLGPEIGWAALVLFLALLQPMLSALLLPMWLFFQRIMKCDPLRERI